MAQSKTSKKQQAATRWHTGSTPFEDLAPHEQLAHQIVSQFRDLAPSVERIMSAEITEDQRLNALTAFQGALGQSDDPNRDPRIAIANATKSKSK